MTEKEGKADAQPFHLVLLAKDLVGYRNLCRLSPTPTSTATTTSRGSTTSISQVQRGPGRPVSACLGGEIPRALEIEDWDSARRLAGEYQDILGKGNFFLELQDHGMPEQRVLNEKLLRLAPETGIPLVVTNDLHYVHESQSDAQDVLLCIGTGNNIDTPGRMKFAGNDFWLKSASQMAALFPDQREAILNTRRIAEMTDLELPLGQLRIPHFPVPGWPHRRDLAPRGVPARPPRALRNGHPGAPAAAGLRARRDPLDGLRRLLPDRRRLRPLRPRAADPDDVPRLARRARS